MLALIADYPLAWVVPVAGPPTDAAMLPLVAQLQAGRLSALIGHLSRRNPLVAALEADPRALILVQGPQDYVSPELVSKPGWAPTWNYAQLRIEAEVTFGAPDIDKALDVLTDAMERDRAAPWTSAKMGERYGRMAPHIIGFTARVTKVEGKFKLGQDEDATSYGEIVAGHPNAEMVRWMERMNDGRARG